MADIEALILSDRNIIPDEEYIFSILGDKTGVVTVMAENFYTNDLPAAAAVKGDNVTIKCTKVRKNDKVYVLEKRI